ncbi:Ig-like domain-containing protein [Cesiribacter andamanensis]|uniref:SbsA Ig-like domain-containing protein n=1 Tax=Cesiribacter andamanensis AMV16 TaxID=1279009 RepID=M7NMW8_9BACT|nr:Ig-like domain-containing protein [Cesiribacter andamanensis]EMR03100.1 hypothetical protein ADICEAN_01759 [Cesiribacter andamanensis AMV16]
MRIYVSLSFLLIIAALWYGTTGCANVGSPTGGSKDTIPPQLLTSLPLSGSVNYKQGIIRMEFSEAVVLKNLQSQLIISPRTSVPYKTRVNRNVVELRFDKPFADSTTYTFNFRDGIVDITEGNPVPNLYLAFSTGSYLDSLRLQGNVQRALTNAAADGATVAIYDARDTLNIFSDKPLYFTKTDKEGNYEIRNLKRGRYLVYAFNDKNNNLTLQSKDEAYGFWPDTLQLQASQDSINISTFRANADVPAITNARPTTAGYYEVTFNKSMQNYRLQLNTGDSIASNFIEEQKKIRIYPFALQDSLGATLLAWDSLQQQLEQQIMIRFEPGRRKREALVTTSVLPKANTALSRTVTFELTFNKPIASLRLDSIRLVYDSITFQGFAPADVRWNERRDKLRLQKTLQPPRRAVQPPSATADAQTLARQGSEGAGQNARLLIPKGSIQSVESDTLDNQEVSYKIAQESQTGIISGTIQSAETNFILQLVRANNFEVVAEQYNARSYTFRFVEAGEYRLRIIRDLNNNGRWDAGNIRKLQAPEPVYVYPDPISIKAQGDPASGNSAVKAVYKWRSAVDK